MNKNKVKPCSTCGVMPVIECWSSGGFRVAVRCNNPDRPDSCDIPFYYSISNNPDEAVARWNEYQKKGEIYEQVKQAWEHREKLS